MNEQMSPDDSGRQGSSRRRFLFTTAGGALAVLGQRSRLFGDRFGQGGWPTRPARAQRGASEFVADIEIALEARPLDLPILPGAPTRVWAYRAELIRGPASSLEALPASYLGPTIRIRRHQKLRVHFSNSLAEPSVVHWHGLHVPALMDGHPRMAIAPGETMVYEFEVTNRAGTYWYHPHPHGRTGAQVYQGLAGLFLVADDAEDAVGLPSGVYDLPLVIQDRSFTSANQLRYADSAMNGMMGFLGERILVNGQPDAQLSVGAQPHRLRLLNGSNSRIYKLAWEDRSPLTVIGTDGGLIPQPVQRPFVMLAPGERVELLQDFGRFAGGPEVTLQSLAFEAGAPGSGSAPANGSPVDVLRLRVEPEDKSDQRAYLPFAGLDRGPVSSSAMASVASGVGGPRSRSDDPLPEDDPPETTRTFRLSAGMMAWLINGRSFEMEAVAADEIIPMGVTEIWEFINEGDRRGMGGMGMAPQAHPIHIHGPQFEIVGREIDPAWADAWATVQAGYVDEGRKDTVLIMPGERVRLKIRFEDHAGLFLYHCHNLEHEDRGMMRNYQVV